MLTKNNNNKNNQNAKNSAKIAHPNISCLITGCVYIKIGNVTLFCEEHLVDQKHFNMGSNNFFYPYNSVNIANLFCYINIELIYKF